MSGVVMIVSIWNLISCQRKIQTLEYPVSCWSLKYPGLWIIFDCLSSFYIYPFSFIQPLDQIAKYFSEQGIPFPKIEISEEDRENLKECYVFEEADSPKAPTVLFFPLVNDTFKKYKAPGESSVIILSEFFPFHI